MQMPAPSRKRRRSSVSTPARGPSKRKPAPPEDDEDILSDDVDSPPGTPPPTNDQEDDADDDDDNELGLEAEPENETAEQKRLRLARNYLRHMGISETATDDEDDSGTANRRHASGDRTTGWPGDGGGGGGGDDDDDDDDSDEEEGPNDLLRRKAMVETGRAVVELADRFAASSRKAVASRPARGHAQAPTAVALAGDGESVAVSAGKDSRVLVWDVETGTRTATFKPTLPKLSVLPAGGGARRRRQRQQLPAPLDADGHLGPVHAVAVTDDGRLAVTGGRDALVRVWDLRAGDKPLVRSLRGHRGAVTTLAFRQGTRQLFSGGADRTVKVWDMDELAYADTLFGHGGEVCAVDSLSNERALSAGRDGTLRLYKLAEESQLVYRRAETMSIDAVAMVTEQRFVSGGDDGAFCMWQMNKKKAVAVVPHAHGNGLDCDSWISAVAAFRNTDLALSGGGDGCVRLWRCEKVPKLIDVGKISLGRGFVNSLAVGPSHRVVVAAIGKEHRLGRWSTAPGGKNGVHFMRLPELS